MHPMNKSVLITGIAGSGKSAVYDELVSRGLQAHDIEDNGDLFAWLDGEGAPVADHDNNSLKDITEHRWTCDREKLAELIRDNAQGVVFYCGTADNLDELLPCFDVVILLQVTRGVLEKRLKTRKTSEFGKTAETQEWILNRKERWEEHLIKQGAIKVDTNRDVSEIGADIDRICSSS